MQVTGEAQGSEDNIQSFLKEINSGPRAAHVVKVEKEEIKIKVRTLQINVRLFRGGTNDFLLQLSDFIQGLNFTLMKQY